MPLPQLHLLHLPARQPKPTNAKARAPAVTVSVARAAVRHGAKAEVMDAAVVADAVAVAPSAAAGASAWTLMVKPSPPAQTLMQRKIAPATKRAKNVAHAVAVARAVAAIAQSAPKALNAQNAPKAPSAARKPMAQKAAITPPAKPASPVAAAEVAVAAAMTEAPAWTRLAIRSQCRIRKRRTRPTPVKPKSATTMKPATATAAAPATATAASVARVPTARRARATSWPPRKMQRPYALRQAMRPSSHHAPPTSAMWPRKPMRPPRKKQRYQQPCTLSKTTQRPRLM